jgi:hypothetical protein
MCIRSRALLALYDEDELMARSDKDKQGGTTN